MTAPLQSPVASERPRGRGVLAFGRNALVLLLLLTGCTANAADERRTVTVFAAASLSKAFEDVERAYEKAHPGSDVVLSFAGSQSLVAQIEQGAPADVLATADVQTVTTVRDELRSAPVVFAHNQLAIVTAPGNPRGVTSLGDLERRDLAVVVAAPNVPVGKAAAKALATAGVTIRPVSLEDAVTGVVGKVRLGEADAGIAYVTDLGGGVHGVPLPGTTTDLAIAPLTRDGDPFISFVLGPEGREALRANGFR